METINEDKISEALTNYIEYHNNTIKSSTKFIPNEIRDIENPELIEKIIIAKIIYTNTTIIFHRYFFINATNIFYITFRNYT